VGWIRALTAAQQRILGSLALSVVVVTGVLVWSVWSTLRQPPAPSPLATPSPPQATATPMPTATPTGTPTPTPTPSPAPTVAFDISRAGIIASEVAAARQVSERWGTPLTLVDETGMARTLHTHYQENPLLAARLRPVLTAFRLWFWDPLRVDVVTQSQRGASFYSPQLRELYLRRDWTGTQAALELHLSYGYARAIPEQIGNLSAHREEAFAGSTTRDRALTLEAVAEGDALVAVLLHQGVEPGSPRAMQIQAELAEAICPVWRDDDPLLRALSCIAFELGADFATTLYREGGTAAMDAAILRPPRSTKQLLHPELYLQPASIVGERAGDGVDPLNPLQPSLGRGWGLTVTDTLGEALTAVILQEWGNEIVEPETVAGWNGDLLQVWETGEREAWVAAWQLAWERSVIAGRVYGHLLNGLPDILVPGLVTHTATPAHVPRGRWWSGSEGTAFLYRSRDRIWLIWGTDADIVATVAGEIP
jgi:hypothetical protein